MSPSEYPIYGFAVVFLVFWCTIWTFRVLALIHGKRKLHRRLKTSSKTVLNHVFGQKTLKKQRQLRSLLPQPLPPVSILKPLMGVDANLQQNLESCFSMNYHPYELLFCVEDKSDPVISLVEMLMRKYPLIDSKLFIGGSGVGVNPKINNLHPGYEGAKYELVMISDSSVRFKEDTLLDMVQHMTNEVGLVHQLPFTWDSEGFAAIIEKIYFGTALSFFYLMCDWMGITCTSGMSLLMRKSLLDKLGGLQAFGGYLAEDLFLGEAFRNHGWKIVLSSHPGYLNAAPSDLNPWKARITRWIKLRIAVLPLNIVLEPIIGCTVLSCLTCWSVSVLFHWEALVFFLMHVLLWLLSDWLMLSIVQNGKLPFTKFEFVVGWLTHEYYSLYLFISAVLDPVIRWRGREFRIARDGNTYEITRETNG